MPGFRKYAKKVARGGAKFARKVGKNVRKRYSGKSAIPNLLHDVTMLKKLVNVEKKRYDMTSSQAFSFGQTNGAGVTGAICAALSPVVPQGLTGSTRNGNSFKLVSACLDMYFNQSVNATNGGKIRWFLFMRKDNAVDLLGNPALAQLLEPNPFSAVIDYHSSRDAEFFTAYKVIKQGTVNLATDSLTNQISYAQRKIPLKMSYHQKFNTDASTTTTKNKFFLGFTMDTGDATALTGAQVQWNMRWYYTDN